MSDYFHQEATLRVADPQDPWRVAADILSLMEICLGDEWKKVRLDFTATTPTLITFRASDLTSLESQCVKHGGPLRDISIYAVNFNPQHHISVNGMVLVKDKTTDRVLITYSVPLRVELESFQFSIQRVFEHYKKRKRWASGMLTFDKLRHQSEAASDPGPARVPVIKTAGIKWGARRWFVQNRDSIIIGLSTGLLVTLSILALQLFGILPVPQ